MRVWALNSDGDNFDNLGVIGKYDLDFMRAFDGRSHEKGWIPLAVEYIPMRRGEKRKGFANFTDINVSSIRPVMDVQAIKALNDLMLGSVEILPLDFLEKDFYLINVTEDLNCIDLDKSEYTTFSSGKISHFTKYVFYENVLENKHIYRITSDYTRVPYVSDEFRQRVIDNGLTGFRFTLIWDSKDADTPAKAQEEYRVERDNMANRYINLKKGFTNTVPESQLINAVRTWMYGKYTEDSPSLYSVITALPEPCQYVFSMDSLITEIENGGFNQFFFNFDRRFGKLAEKGFKELRLKDVAAIVGKANKIYEEDVSKLSDNIDSMEDFMNSYKDNPLNEIDHLFCNIKSLEKWESLCIEYIKFCAYAFGD